MTSRVALWSVSMVLLAALGAVALLLADRARLTTEVATAHADLAAGEEAERERASDADVATIAVETALDDARAAVEAAERRVTELETELDTVRANLEAAEQAAAREMAMPTEPATVYLAPDPATLRTVVRETFRSQLGREPHDHELATMTQLLVQLHREQHDAEQAGAPFDLVSRYLEEFETGYDGELEMYRTRDERARQNQLLRESLDGMQCQVRGTC